MHLPTNTRTCMRQAPAAELRLSAEGGVCVCGPLVSAQAQVCFSEHGTPACWRWYFQEASGQPVSGGAEARAGEVPSALRHQAPYMGRGLEQSV